MRQIAMKGCSFLLLEGGMWEKESGVRLRIAEPFSRQPHCLLLFPLLWHSPHSWRPGKTKGESAVWSLKQFRLCWVPKIPKMWVILCTWEIASHTQTGNKLDSWWITGLHPCFLGMICLFWDSSSLSLQLTFAIELSNHLSFLVLSQGSPGRCHLLMESPNPSRVGNSLCATGPTTLHCCESKYIKTYLMGSFLFNCTS